MTLTPERLAAVLKLISDYAWAHTNYALETPGVTPNSVELAKRAVGEEIGRLLDEIERARQVPPPNARRIHELEERCALQGQDMDRVLKELERLGGIVRDLAAIGYQDGQLTDEEPDWAYKVGDLVRRAVEATR